MSTKKIFIPKSQNTVGNYYLSNYMLQLNNNNVNNNITNNTISNKLNTVKIIELDNNTSFKSLNPIESFDLSKKKYLQFLLLKIILLV